METSSAPVNIDLNLQRNRAWDWRAALFVFIIVQISSIRLVVTEWTPFLYFTQTMGFFGVALGLALGYGKFSRQAVVRLAAGYTLMLVPAQLLSAVEKTGWLWHDILALADRLFISLDQFIRNKPVEDALFFVSIVTLTYWLIGLAAGYWLTRHWDFLNVVLPSGLAILIVQAFDVPRSEWTITLDLAIFLFASLLLMARMYFLKNRPFWKGANFLLTDEARSDLERGALAVAAIAVFVAWSLPGWINGAKPVAKAWREFSQPIFDKYSNAVSALDSPYTVSTSGNFYGASLALGERAATGDTVIFTVKLPKGDFTPVRSYWKGRSYDLYSRGLWTTGESSSIPFIPTIDEIAIEYPQSRHEMGFTFTSRAERQSLLYTPAGTVWVSKNANLQSASTREGMPDITAWISATSLSNGEQYKTRALIADPTIEELRSAGTEYPVWVKERYLHIPAEIAPQLRELALEITASHETAYDKAQAITSYLRGEIKYQKTMEESPPPDRDPVLWVLFEYKKGFCMYYASAETLMLRSIGIPARMAVGFVEGEYDDLDEKYTVVYEDSHAWPEVYFPGIGWVEFEPTSSQFPLERPETRDTANETGPDSDEDLALTPLPTPLEERPRPLLDEDADIGGTSSYTKWYQGILTPFLIVLAVGLAIFVVRHYSLNDRLPVYLAYQYERRGSVPPQWLSRWVRWTILSPIERAFQSVNLSLHWLGKPQPLHATSQERAQALIKLMPEAEEQTLSLLEEYHNAMYTPRAGNLHKARKAALTILVKARQTLIKETLQFPDSRFNQLK
ncbi:MAG: transglutaminase domain-containing protein [Chloroflexi bacterium]|nr:transglutaminase domain-containing protein [Chloroflexota bacterium]